MNTAMKASTSLVRWSAAALFAVVTATSNAVAQSSSAVARPATVAAESRAALDTFMRAQHFGAWRYVDIAPGNRGPSYPDSLRRSRTVGTVLAQFVVDTAGHVDPANAITIVSSTDDRFTASVRQVLPAMRFVAAEVDGQKVKQVTQLPFAFLIDGAGDVRPAEDSAHRNIPCGKGQCPVLRLEEVVVITVAPR